MKRAIHLSVALIASYASLMGCSSGDEDDSNTPSFTSSPGTKASVGAKYEYKVTTEDSNGDARTIVAKKAPKWLKLEDAGDGTATLSGTPTPVDTGKQAVELEVSDKDGATGQRFEIDVNSDFVANTIEDEFDGDTLSDIWHISDPLKDSSVVVADGLVHISVKGGVGHDLWVGEENTAPRILQNVENKDFGIEVKFDSVPTKQYQMNGVIAQETNDHFVRFELHHDGTSQRIYAASINGTNARIRHNKAVEGDPPNQLRIMRNGEFWTLQYSADGKKWTDAAAFSEPLKVTAVGLYGGNARGKDSPEFTSKADFFHNTDLSSLPNLQLPEAPISSEPEPDDDEGGDE